MTTNTSESKVSGQTVSSSLPSSPPSLGGNARKLRRYAYLFVKRAFDITASLAALLILSPVLLLTALAIYIDDPGPVLFFQPRIGKDDGTFKMVKFRSMATDAEARLERLTPEEKEEFYTNFKLKHDPRITRVGHFIRHTSIDELPQFWNVLVGDMSLVGPRPPLLVEREAYGEHLAKVMSVQPGITGYWQVHGRSKTGFDERIEMAEYYVDNQSLSLDIKILLDTVKVVLGGDGAI